METRELRVCVKIISITEGKRKELVKEKKTFKNLIKYSWNIRTPEHSDISYSIYKKNDRV